MNRKANRKVMQQDLLHRHCCGCNEYMQKDNLAMNHYQLNIWPLFSFERDLFEELIKDIEVSDKKVNELLNGRKEESQKNDLVVFKSDVPVFLGLEGEKIGPFEKGQMANIPKAIAQILVEDQKVEIIEK